MDGYEKNRMKIFNREANYLIGEYRSDIERLTDEITDLEYELERLENSPSLSYEEELYKNEVYRQLHDKRRRIMILQERIVKLGHRTNVNEAKLAEDELNMGRR